MIKFAPFCLKGGRLFLVFLLLAILITASCKKEILTASGEIPDLGYAKLAWLRGIEVTIEHPLVPSELLSYRPISHYEDKYDFLK